MASISPMAAQQKRPAPSILQLLRKANPSQQHGAEKDVSDLAPKRPVGGISAYVQEVKQQICSGRQPGLNRTMMAPDPFQAALDINAQRHHDGESLLSSEEILNLVLRPDVVAWAPNKISGDQICCPTCRRPATASEWTQPRTLHTAQHCKLYMTMRYKCLHCPSGLKDKPQTSKKRAAKKTFVADAPGVLSLLPAHVRTSWNFTNTGRVMCDNSVADLVRALAIKNSWSGIADAINEMKATHWVRCKIQVYLNLCASLNLRPVSINPDLPKDLKLSADWVKIFFVDDSNQRLPEITAAMSMERGDDILLLDWTCDAAARCGKAYLLNAMDSEHRVLLSQLTDTCKPYEAEVALRKLAQRGVHPKVVYVDDECCGAWPNILHKIWPDVEIRLDVLHAIMRLTKTTASTQHPWHGRFCIELSNAFHEQDQMEVNRFRRAWFRDGRGSASRRDCNKHVPRRIASPAAIIETVDAILEQYAAQMHPEMGALTTEATQVAWKSLKPHVENNCVSEPTKIETLAAMKSTVCIGGEMFDITRSRRGSSSLEGFHAHQKQWFGVFAHHSKAAGEALLAEGATRWNRKRRNEASAEKDRTPNVFAKRVLQGADDLHVQLTAERLYPTLAPASFD